MAVDLTEITSALGRRVRELREGRGLTQADASTRAGLSIQTWSRLERGAAQNHTLDTLAAIADALRVTVGELFEGVRTENPAGNELEAMIAGLDDDARAALIVVFRALRAGAGKG